MNVLALLNDISPLIVCDVPFVNINRASTSVCNSAIAVLTVDAVVPNAPAVIVPSLVLIVAISVSLETISVCSSLTAPLNVVADVSKEAVPISVFKELVAVTKSDLSDIPAASEAIVPTSS